MTITKEMNLKQFKTIINKSLAELFGEVEEIDVWKFKVCLSKKEFIVVDIQKVWEYYELTKDVKVLIEFIETQCDIVVSLNSEKKKYDNIVKDLVPSVRSTEIVKKMQINDVITKETFLNGFENVVLYEQKRYSQILNREQFEDLPDDKEIMKAAIDNLKEKGWTKEVKKIEKDTFEIYLFEDSDYSINYQFFIKEWVDKHLGDCYIAFPTNKVAFILKLKTDDWKDWVKSLNLYSRMVKETYLKEKNALSFNLIKYENGEYEVI